MGFSTEKYNLAMAMGVSSDHVQEFMETLKSYRGFYKGKFKENLQNCRELYMFCFYV